MRLAIWTDDPRHQLWRSLLTAGCLYEITALYTTLPTVTTIVRRWHRHPHPVIRAAVYVWFSIWLGHFVPGEPVTRKENLRRSPLVGRTFLSVDE